MKSPHAATRQRAQTPLAANAARPLDLIDACPVPLVAAASAVGEKTQLSIRPPSAQSRAGGHASVVHSGRMNVWLSYDPVVLKRYSAHPSTS